MDIQTIIWILVIAVIILVIAVVLLLRRKPDSIIEVDEKNVGELADFVRAMKREQEEKQSMAAIRKTELKSKLEHFKQTKDELRDRLSAKFNMKGWTPLSNILNSTDKGTVGIYVLYNRSKNKYYVGQAKALISRIKKHFDVESIAKDFLQGDSIDVKVLTATELGNDYRMDHIEKMGIEIFDANNSGYNKTAGNL